MGIAIWLVPSEPESALLLQLMSRYPKPSDSRSFPHFYPHITLATICPPTAPQAVVVPVATAEDTGRPLELEKDESNTRDKDSTTLLALALRESIPIGQRRSLSIRFARVLTGDTYFLSIYIAIAPSDQLAQLRSSALTAVRSVQVAGGGGGVGGGDAASNLEEMGASPAFPHLSLFYIADEEAHTRVRVLQEMEREGVVRHSDDGLSVALRCVQADGAGEGGGGGGDVLDGFTATQIWIVDCEGPVEGWKVLDKILLATSDR